jgi:hypothetical protein
MICGARTPSNGRDTGWCDLNGTIRLGVASAAQHHVLMAAKSTYQGTELHHYLLGPDGCKQNFCENARADSAPAVTGPRYNIDFHPPLLQTSGTF